MDLSKSYWDLASKPHSGNIKMNSLKVIATYFGDRRRIPIDASQAYNMLCYTIEKEMEVDSGYPMDTLFVVSEPNCEDSYTQKCYDLLNDFNGKRTKNGKAIVLHRENFGLSYGAYNDAFLKYRHDYKYWFFTEDDHIIVKDGYIKKAIAQFELDEDIGFVSGILILRNRGMYYCAGGIGLTSADVLEKVARDTWHIIPCELHKDKCLPHSFDTGYAEQWLGEAAFTHAIFRQGYKFVDLDMDKMCISWGRADRRCQRMAQFDSSLGPVAGDNVARALPNKLISPAKPCPKPTVNYVIASWLGTRRDNYDGIEILNKHLKTLSTLRHSLTQISIVIPHFDGEPDVSWITSLNHMFPCPLYVLRRKNIGLSYGSYSHTFETYWKAFDYYIFIEDDYAPVRNDFDRELIEIYEEKDCAYLCSFNTLKQKNGCNISNGIASFPILKQVYEHFGELPHEPNAPQYKAVHQTSFINSFDITGKKVVDYTDRFRSPYWNSLQGRCIELNPSQEDYIIKPIQLL